MGLHPSLVMYASAVTKITIKSLKLMDEDNNIEKANNYETPPKEKKQILSSQSKRAGEVSMTEQSDAKPISRKTFSFGASEKIKEK